MKILVMYSSLTGNTKKVAEAISQVLPPNDTTVMQITPTIDVEAYDLIFAGFWVDKSTADKLTGAVLQRIEGKKVALFATLGAYPNTPYAEKCLTNAAALLPVSNELVGTYHCQGKVNPQIAERFKSLPKDHPHAMTPERIERHRIAALHPDAADFAAAAEFAKKILIEVSES
ncbi:MAG TPA: flavodoxin [Candidatus Avacidaminococcus intestinavium]|uniref:Flavodoxin n=1 Tax=Candidatus Avacidaminococcus intestinavium TaxID=2840684 RepID=A0A9D1SLK0_9FIRM|nr:flavodoxin [Candidatus Avacidaminococcus intestinavium]